MARTIAFALLLSTSAVPAQIRIYPLDGDATETVSGQDGTLGAGAAAPTDTTDRFGMPSGAMYFNGDDLIEIPATGLTNDEFSVSAWVLVSQNPSSLQMDFLAIGDDAEDQAFGVANDAFGTGFFQAGYVDVGSPTRVFATTLPTEDIWYHVVVTRSLTELKLYVNGALIDVENITGTLPAYGASPVAFIGNRYVNLRPWIGIIDDLRIWDVALTQAEVDLVNLVSDVSAGSGFSVFPSPTTRSVQVRGAEPGERVQVRDALGALVHESLVISTSMFIDLGDLATGLYFVSLRSARRTGIVRVVKE